MGSLQNKQPINRKRTRLHTRNNHRENTRRHSIARRLESADGHHGHRSTTRPPRTSINSDRRQNTPQQNCRRRSRSSRRIFASQPRNRPAQFDTADRPRNEATNSPRTSTRHRNLRGEHRRMGHADEQRLDRSAAHQRRARIRGNSRPHRSNTRRTPGDFRLEDRHRPLLQLRQHRSPARALRTSGMDIRLAHRRTHTTPRHRQDKRNHLPPPSRRRQMRILQRGPRSRMGRSADEHAHTRLAQTKRLIHAVQILC